VAKGAVSTARRRPMVTVHPKRKHREIVTIVDRWIPPLVWLFQHLSTSRIQQGCLWIPVLMNRSAPMRPARIHPFILPSASLRVSARRGCAHGPPPGRLPDHLRRCDASFTSRVMWRSRTCSVAASVTSSVPSARLRRLAHFACPVAVEQTLRGRLRNILGSIRTAATPRSLRMSGSRRGDVLS